MVGENISVKLTTDLAQVRAEVESCWPAIADDRHPTPFHLPNNWLARGCYFAVTIGTTNAGIIAVMDGSLHSMLRGCCRGRAAIDALAQAIELYRLTGATELHAFCFSHRPEVRLVIRRLGFIARSESDEGITIGGRPVLTQRFKMEFSPCHS